MTQGRNLIAQFKKIQGNFMHLGEMGSTLRIALQNLKPNKLIISNNVLNSKASIDENGMFFGKFLLF